MLRTANWGGSFHEPIRPTNRLTTEISCRRYHSPYRLLNPSLRCKTSLQTSPGSELARSAKCGDVTWTVILRPLERRYSSVTQMTRAALALSEELAFLEIYFLANEVTRKMIKKSEKHKNPFP